MPKNLIFWQKIAYKKNFGFFSGNRALLLSSFHNYVTFCAKAKKFLERFSRKLLTNQPTNCNDVERPAQRQWPCRPPVDQVDLRSEIIWDHLEWSSRTSRSGRKIERLLKTVNQVDLRSCEMTWDHLDLPEIILNDLRSSWVIWDLWGWSEVFW